MDFLGSFGNPDDPLGALDGSGGPLIPDLGEDEIHVVGHLHPEPEFPPPLLLQTEAAPASSVVCELVGSLHAVLINTEDRDCLAKIRAAF